MADGTRNNLLTALHKWARRQDENFISEAFSHLLRQLLDEAPGIGVSLLRSLTDGRVDVPVAKAKQVDVNTQITTDLGRPDIEIRTAEHLVFVEVKMESNADRKQLERYRTALAKDDCPNRTLVLLTRYPVENGDDVPGEVVLRCWFQVADHLCQKVTCCQDPCVRFLVEQFTGFLRERGVTMERVGWEYNSGIRAFMNLTNMIGEAIAASGESSSLRGAQQWAGFRIGDGYCWLWLTWEQPSRLVICTTSRDDLDDAAAERVGYGECGDDLHPLWPGRRWWLSVDLDSEDVHFFARTRESQRRFLEEFVARGIAGVKVLTGGQGGKHVR